MQFAYVNWPRLLLRGCTEWTRRFVGRGQAQQRMGEPQRAGPALSDTLLREKQHGVDHWLWLLPHRSHAAHVSHISCSSLPDAPAGFTAEQRRRGHDRPPHPGKVGRPPHLTPHRSDYLRMSRRSAPVTYFKNKIFWRNLTDIIARKKDLLLRPESGFLLID